MTNNWKICILTRERLICRSLQRDIKKNIPAAWCKDFYSSIGTKHLSTEYFDWIYLIWLTIIILFDSTLFCLHLFLSVPGNFHIEARSILHSLNPVMANLSHIVNHLSFGPILSRSATRALEELSEDYFSLKSTEPMNDKAYVNEKLHQAFHHHVKVFLSRWWSFFENSGNKFPLNNVLHRLCRQIWS